MGMENPRFRFLPSDRQNRIVSHDLLFDHEIENRRQDVQFLEERMTRQMIRVGMTRQENLDVREFEPQLLDVAPDDRHRSLEARIDQDMALGCGDEISCESF